MFFFLFLLLWFRLGSCLRHIWNLGNFHLPISLTLNKCYRCISFRRYLEFLAYSCTGNRLKLSSSPHSHSTSLNREIQIWRLWKYLTLENKVSPNFHPLETLHFDEVLPDVMLTTGWVNLKGCGDTLTGVHPVPFRLLLFFSLHFII